MNANDIISAITNSLGTQYPTIKINTENVKQGFIAPSFYVEEINNTSKKQLGRRYIRRYSFSLKYYPSSSGDINKEMHNVSDTLCEVLELMQYETTIAKGINMESRIDDNVLHFQFDVKINLLKENTNNKFGQLEVDINAK